MTLVYWNLSAEYRKQRWLNKDMREVAVWIVRCPLMATRDRSLSRVHYLNTFLPVAS